METQEKIAVMQAYADGKQIQFRKAETEEEWADLSYTRDPTWNWKNNEYRVEPELKKPSYRPYANFAEFRAEWKKHGGWTNDKCNSNRRFIEVYNDGFADTLLTYYTWVDDGTPCGIKVED